MSQAICLITLIIELLDLSMHRFEDMYTVNMHTTMCKIILLIKSSNIGGDANLMLLRKI
jgi:hypothetical protein